MPLLKAKLQWNSALDDEAFVVIADDPAARRDIPLWADRVGAAITIQDNGTELRFHIAKKSRPSD